jgi:aspartate/tyrosine/aromatic aminotransferase
MHLLAVTRPTILLLHGGPTHNPTGLNLSVEQVQSLVDVIRSRPVFVYIDFAYLGLGDGLEKDCEIPRLLLRELEEVAVGVSFSKNATLYAHRAGALIVKTKQRETVQSNLRQLIRSSISSAPVFGQKVMATLWKSFPNEWIRDVNVMREEVDRCRNLFIDRLPEFAALRDTRGLFGVLPLSDEEIRCLRKHHAVHLLPGGRVNFGGMETDRLDYLVQALQQISEV